jgi:RNA polymerase sigma-70 factor (ECF subfamily)
LRRALQAINDSSTQVSEEVLLNEPGTQPLRKRLLERALRFLRDFLDHHAGDQRALLERYGGTVHRYLLGALRDPDAADELFQEFCLRFLRGAFQRADRDRGRFRDFVKTALFHLVVDYRQGLMSRPRGLEPGMPEPAVAPPEPGDTERGFLESWREELLDQTWRALELQEQKTGQPHHSVLRLRADQPLLSSAELAEQLGRQLGKPCTVAATRQALHRAREKYADLLLQEVVHSLNNPTPHEMDEELAELGLLAYCESALKRRGHRGSP